jgi:hypothetical protein
VQLVVIGPRLPRYYPGGANRFDHRHGTRTGKLPCHTGCKICLNQPPPFSGRRATRCPSSENPSRMTHGPVPVTHDSHLPSSCFVAVAIYLRRLDYQGCQVATCIALLGRAADWEGSMSTGRVAVTVKRAWFSISRSASQQRSSTHSVDARRARRWPRVLAALWFAAGLLAFPCARAWGQTAARAVLGLRQRNATILTEQLQRFAAAKETLTPSQQKVDSHLRRLAWPGQAEAQALAPPLVPPPWQQGTWLHVYAHLHATTQNVLDELRARGLAIERVNTATGPKSPVACALARLSMPSEIAARLSGWKRRRRHTVSD